MTSLDKEYKYFQEHRNELLTQYRGKYVVIAGDVVVNTYDSEEQAYQASIKKYKLGEFLIQLCLPEKELPPQVFHSRVVF